MKFARISLIRLLAVIIASGNFFIPWGAALPARAAGIEYSGIAPAASSIALPVVFEKNQGQAPAEVLYTGRIKGMSVSLAADRAVIAVRSKTGRAAVSLKPVGADEAVVSGEGLQAGRTGYLFGKDQSKWISDVANYDAVRYAGIYPGIDLRYYGNNGSLEYDYVVSPKADPAKIITEISGADSLAFVNGDLAIATSAGAITLKRPIAYQDKNGAREAVEVAYSTNGNLLSFVVGGYDRSLPLVIDPVLAYSTFVGGTGLDNVFDVASDALGNLYVTGVTESAVFTGAYFMPPITMDPDPANATDAAFVVKLNPTGDTIGYVLVFGGDQYGGGTQARGVSVDANGNAYVTGFCSDTGFPTTPGAIKANLDGYAGATNDGFVAKINPAGNSFVYATLLGGTNTDWPIGIKVNAAGNAFVAGMTQSTNYPTTAGAYQTAFGEVDNSSGAAFVSELNTTGTGLVYSTYVRPHNNEEVASFGLDSSGRAYLTGKDHTVSPEVVTPYLTRLNATGTALDYFTTIANSNSVESKSLAVDGSSNVYVAGSAGCGQLATTAGVFQPACASAGDGFVAKYNSTGAVAYATYLGGSQSDYALSVGVDTDGNAYVGGGTASTDFPVVNPPVGMTKNTANEYDAFMTKIVPDGSAIEYSTYFGGDSSDFATKIFVDPSNNIIVSGDTTSANFPITQGVVWPTPPGGGNDGFLVKFGASDAAVASANNTANANIAPMISGESGISGALMNLTPGSGPVTMVIERLGLAPKGKTSFNIGGSLVDIKVTGAHAADEAVVTIYYGDNVTGSNEDNLALMYTDENGKQKAVKTKGNINPGKDKTNNKKGTKSGGTLEVTFDSDSKPTIMELTGTVFGSTNTLPGNLDLLKMEVDSWTLAASKKTTLQGYLDATLNALAVGQNSTAVSRMNSFKSRVNSYVADGSTTAYVVASALDSATTIIANIPAFTPGGEAWNAAKDIINGLVPQIAPLPNIMPASEKSYLRGKLYDALDALAVGNQGAININGSAMERMNSFKTRVNSDIGRGWISAANATPLKDQAQAAMDIIAANPPLPGRISQ